MSPEIFVSTVERPYVISVDGDIPQGATIVLICEGTTPGGGPWRQVFENPICTPFDQAINTAFDFRLLADPKTLASPFLHAVVIEGDGQKYVFQAEMLAALANRTDSILMRPEHARPYFTLRSPFFPLADVSVSETQMPFLFEVVGNTPSDSKLICQWISTEADGSKTVQTFFGPCRDPLILTKNLVLGIELKLSTDGNFPPTLWGIAIEGGNRRHFLSATKFAETFGEGFLNNLQIIKFNDGRAMITLASIPPKFDGPPEY